MESLSDINALTEILGPLVRIIARCAGFGAVAITVVMMMRQPEDPLNKLKRGRNTSKGKTPKKLRQGAQRTAEEIRQLSRTRECRRTERQAANAASGGLSVSKTRCGSFTLPKCPGYYRPALRYHLHLTFLEAAKG